MSFIDVMFRVKLAQLWNTVPKTEKLTWSRKAKTLIQKSSRLSKVSSQRLRKYINNIEAQLIVRNHTFI